MHSATIDSRAGKRGFCYVTKISLDQTVTFPYDNVQYEAVVERINSDNATVTLTKITGTPRRPVSVGETVRVAARI
jgi:hypothetical protein